MSKKRAIHGVKCSGKCSGLGHKPDRVQVGPSNRNQKIFDDPRQRFLSDGGGVFGFFLGVTMLNCLQTTFEHTLNWSSKIRKRKREKVFTVNQESSMRFRIRVLIGFFSELFSINIC